MLLLNPIVQKILFSLIGVVLSVALLPMQALQFVAPQWEELAETVGLIQAMSKAAFYDPGPKRDNPYFLPGDAQLGFAPGEHWTMGFGKANLTNTPEIRAKIAAGHYHIAGFGRTPSASVMDDMYVKAIYLNDNTGRGGLLYAVVDCIGLSGTDANQIRALVWGWANAAGVKSIQVAATHMHSGIDTIGLWADIPEDGKDAAFQQRLIEQAALALRAAYDNRQDGRLFIADTEMAGMMEDSRAPYVYDTKLTRLRFEPFDDDLSDVYLISTGVHPEMMGPANPKISADFPAYATKYIYEQTGAETMFIQGALGLLITPPDYGTVLHEHNYKGNVTYGPSLVPGWGERFGQYALGEIGRLSEEAELPAILNITSMQIDLPVENIALLLSVKLRVLNHGVYTRRGRWHIPIEISYLRLGDLNESVDILIVPGELAPEIAFGGFMEAAQSATGKAYARPALFEALDRHEFASQRQVVFGMANNFIGYIIPENDFYLHRWLPYINIGERNGRSHYEESVSAGRQTAKIISEGFEGIFAGLAE